MFKKIIILIFCICLVFSISAFAGGKGHDGHSNGKGHDSHGNGHGYGHDKHGGDDPGDDPGDNPGDDPGDQGDQNSDIGDNDSDDSGGNTTASKSSTESDLLIKRKFKSGNNPCDTIRKWKLNKCYFNIRDFRVYDGRHIPVN